MGSHAAEPQRSPSDKVLESVNVLVTGFGPFRNVAVNPSYLIAQALPPTISTARHLINVHAHPAPVQVSYHHVRTVVPKLLFTDSPSSESSHTVHSLDSDVASTPPSASHLPARPSSDETSRPRSRHSPVTVPSSGKTAESGLYKTTKSTPNYDIVLFVGVAPGQTDYTLETCARRNGYEKEDADGNLVGRDAYPDEDGVPEMLKTGIALKSVWQRWREALKGENLRPSLDAGLYLCEFIYYTGLYEYYRRDRARDRPVVFLHVPMGVADADVARGAHVAAELIKAIVESRGVGRTSVGSGADMANEGADGGMWS